MGVASRSPDVIDAPSACENLDKEKTHLVIFFNILRRSSSIQASSSSTLMSKGTSTTKKTAAPTTKGPVPAVKAQKVSAKIPQAPQTPNNRPLSSAAPPGRPRKKAANKENVPPVSPLTSAGQGPLVSGSDGSEPSTDLAEENRRLKEKLAQMQAAQGTATAVAQQATATIEPLIRPPGEAGNRRRGFNLQKAMGLEDNTPLYNEIRRNLRTEITLVGLDVNLKWNEQDMRKNFRYLTTKRFPGNWAIAEMIKGYGQGSRKRARRARRGGSTEESGDENGDAEEMGSGDEEESGSDEEDEDLGDNEGLRRVKRPRVD
ncbi:hypothetical protein CVT26_013427 [Gymnopilus dilepis]|uniref:Uncharacterized protein n=1 Tax=Gymnopilus dilepis TaxID=231916 RepID=A0A409WVD8_9AGAR|nr:hypothetical protein CVT26_013427 [Gymnopilus dilepis]